MAEREEELKNLLMRVKEDSEKSGLKFSIKKQRPKKKKKNPKMKTMASGPITSWQIEGKKWK